MCKTQRITGNGIWWDAKGDWKRGHDSAQQGEGHDDPWVHGHAKSPRPLRLNKSLAAYCRGFCCRLSQCLNPRTFLICNW
jgi:hypothetical protein